MRVGADKRTPLDEKRSDAARPAISGTHFGGADTQFLRGIKTNERKKTKFERRRDRLNRMKGRNYPRLKWKFSSDFLHGRVFLSCPQTVDQKIIYLHDYTFTVYNLHKVTTQAPKTNTDELVFEYIVFDLFHLYKSTESICN